MNDHEPRAMKVRECEECEGNGYVGWDRIVNLPNTKRECPRCLGTGVVLDE